MQAKTKRNQNRIFAVGFALIAAVIIWTLARPAILNFFRKDGNSEKEINEEILKAPVAAPEDVFERMKDGEKSVFLDLRETDEFERGHLAGALNVSSSDLNLEKMRAVGAERTSSVIVMNRGDDAFEAARKTNELVSAGYVNAKYLQGGIFAWQREGYPLVSGGGSRLDEQKIKTASVSELAEDLSSGRDVIQFVDVRDENDFRAGRVPGAANIPLAEIEKNAGSVSPVKKVVVYGAGEDEAKKAAVALFDLNFFNIHVLSGGFEAWKAEGGTVESI